MTSSNDLTFSALRILLKTRLFTQLLLTNIRDFSLALKDEQEGVGVLEREGRESPGAKLNQD